MNSRMSTTSTPLLFPTSNLPVLGQAPRQELSQYHGNAAQLGRGISSGRAAEARLLGIKGLGMRKKVCANPSCRP